MEKKEVLKLIFTVAKELQEYNLVSVLSILRENGFSPKEISSTVKVLQENY